jgi:hypothetical protein
MTSRFVPSTLAVVLVFGFGAGPSGRAAAEEASEIVVQAQVHFERGSAFHASGDYQRAAAEYRAAYALYPSAELLFNLGQVARLGGDRKAALEYYQRYLRAEPAGRASEEARNHIEQLVAEQMGLPPKSRRVQLTLARRTGGGATGEDWAEFGPRRETSRPLTRKPWFWGVIGGVGAAVVGGVIAGVVVGTADRPPRPDVVLR